MSTCRIIGGRVSSVAALLLLGIGACGDQGSVVIGVSTGATYLGAARMVFEDETHEGLPPGVDTLLVREQTNRATPAIENAERFTQVERLIAVAGHSNSAASLAAAPLYNEHRIVQLAPNSSAVLYSEMGPFSFRLVPPDDRQGAFLAEYLADRFPDGARLAVQYVNDDYGRGLREAFLEALDQSAFEIVAEVPHIETEVTEADIARAVTTIAVARPDVIVWLARGTVLHEHLPGIRDALGEIPVVGCDATGTGRARSNADGRWDGVMYLDFVDLDGTEELRDFTRRYRDRFGESPTGAHALTYDAVRVLLAGVRAGARTGPEMREYLLSLGRDRDPFPGITGPVSFDEQGDANRSYTVVPVHRPEES